MSVTIYRTNSFTGNPNPFTDIASTLVNIKNQQAVLNGLANYLHEDPEKPDSVGSMLCNMLGEFKDECERYFSEFMARSENYRRDFYNRAIDKIRDITGIKLNLCCWFSLRNIVLSRKNGYGKFLCKENGVLRCYDPGIVLVGQGFDKLCAYAEEPKLMPDTITNNQLISREQLNKLLDLEESYGKILTETCLKKDVLNLLKRADKGLLGNSFTPSFEAQERRIAEERERIISDIL